MRMNEITKVYKENFPITRVEFKKILDQQHICPDIVNDLLSVMNINHKETDLRFNIALMNAIQLGVMIGKQSERHRRKIGLFEFVCPIAKKKEQMSKSIKTWGNMNEWELLEVITELKSMTNENEWYQLKESLLSQARAIFYHNFIKEEINE